MNESKLYGVGVGVGWCCVLRVACVVVATDWFN